MTSIFNSASAANKKIQNVIGQFSVMVKDLNDGIQVLSDVMSKNVIEIEKLTSENTLHGASIKSAESLRNNIENLLK